MWILLQVLTLIKDAVRAVRTAASCIPDGVEAANPQFVGLKVQCRFPVSSRFFPFLSSVSICKFSSPV